MKHKTGLICEGGGTKAAYTAGVLQCFLEEGIEFPYTVGISAGAFCLVPFVSKQKDRLRVTGVDSPSRKQAVGLYPILHEKAVFGIESTYNFVEEEAPLDWEMFKNSPTELEIGLYDVEKGEVVYFNKEEYDREGILVKAACALLLLTHPVKYEGRLYMDGGLIDMIPIAQALRQGCDKCIFISTKEENYVRKPAPNWQLRLASCVYPKQKHVREDLKKRHERYHEQWQMVKDLEAEGKAMILRPSRDMGVTRYTRDHELLTKWYELGISDTKEKIAEIKAFMAD